jgi:carbamoyl-phosphate synthase large subunit
VSTVCSDAQLALVAGRAGYLVQEHLGGDEYTVGCVCDRSGRVGGVATMRRELAHGTTHLAEVGSFPEVRAEAVRIAEALRPAGPLNVQLRVDDGRPVVFELNVRFSGTTPVRARLGFNEVEAALRHFVLGEPLELQEPRPGIAVRYWNELYVPDSARDALARTGRLDDPGATPATVEDWGMRR